MASQTHQLHFLLVPLMSQSHLIPFTNMAKVLAGHGVQVTIVLSPLNAARFSNFLEQEKASNHKTQILLLPFPCVEAGLPEGCENLDTLPSPAYQPLFFAASNMLKEPLEKWLTELETLPSCMVSDLCFPWTCNIASKFNIPRVVFHTVPCFTLLCSHCIHRSKLHEAVTSMSEPFEVPDLPDKIQFTKAQLPDLQCSALKDAKDQFKAAELSAQGIVVNTFEELEKMYVNGYEKVVKKIWCLGPLSLFDKKDGQASMDDESERLKFLNSNKLSSVIYVCFGSLIRLPALQLKEIALGLEESNHPFVWVIRKNDYSTELEKWLAEENFQERIKGRGFIIRGWAPQVEILSHPATGGFLTHCGWNSTLEGVSAGVPMITWPVNADQFYNEKLIVQVLKIGVRIGVEACVDFRETEKGDGVLVKREDLKKAIELLMDKGEEGKQRRNRARELGEMARKAVEEGGSSYLNCNSLIQHITEQVSNQALTG